MANVYTDNYIVQVTEENQPTIQVTEENNLVQVVEHGTPVYVGEARAQLFRYNRIDDYWYADAKISVKGFGEYYNSTYKPIFIFENDIQEFQLDGFQTITSDGVHDPFKIVDNSSNNLFKVTTNGIPVLKTQTTSQTPISGGLMIYNGDLFFGV